MQNPFEPDHTNMKLEQQDYQKRQAISKAFIKLNDEVSECLRNHNVLPAQIQIAPCDNPFYEVVLTLKIHVKQRSAENS